MQRSQRKADLEGHQVQMQRLLAEHEAARQELSKHLAVAQAQESEQAALRNRQDAELGALKARMAQEVNDARIEGERTALLKMELATVASQLEETVSNETCPLLAVRTHRADRVLFRRMSKLGQNDRL
jgi:hypothetical protein